MNGRHHGCALAYRRRHPFDRAAAHVANREYALAVGCQQMASARAGNHKTLIIKRYVAAGQPIGVGLGADEREDMLDYTNKLYINYLFDVRLMVET